MAVYVVGDIQGCYEQLRKLLAQVAFDTAEDTLWCVGDLVNRGPDSLGVLRFLKGLGAACVCVLGNHDLYLLEQFADGQRYCHGVLSEVLNAADCDELIEWLRYRPLLHYDTDLGWCMVHAGLHPNWSLKKAKKRARSVEKQLRGEGWKEFCHQLQYVKFPISEPVRGDPARVLFSAAVLTRTRYCSQDGYFNWQVRTGENSDKKEKAWFRHRRLAWRDDCNVVYGHWAANGLVANQAHVLGLDTGCVWGGSLTLAQLGKSGYSRIVSGIACAAQADCDERIFPPLISGN